MDKVAEFNPLKAIAIPNVGKVQPRGLVVVIGPNSSGKTQMLKDLQARLLGQPRKLVVCEAIDLQRPPDLNPLLDRLCSLRHIRKKVDQKNRVVIESIIPHLGYGSARPGRRPLEVRAEPLLRGLNLPRGELTGQADVRWRRQDCGPLPPAGAEKRGELRAVPIAGVQSQRSSVRVPRTSIPDAALRLRGPVPAGERS